jgi:hypothetical protein
LARIGLRKEATMEMRRWATRLHRRLADWDGRRGKPYSTELRREVTEYLRARIAEGGSPYAVSREIGVSQSSLGRWLRAKRRPRRPGFVPVAIAEEAVHRSDGIVVHGPGGLRIEGLDVDGLVALLRQLG